MSTQGPFAPGTAANSGAGVAWSNPNNCKVDDGNSATVLIGGGTGDSQYLLATNFGFTLPAGSSVVGVTVHWKLHQDLGVGTGCLDYKVELFLSGSPMGANKGLSAGLANLETTYTYGSSSDTWSNTLTETQTNDATFGVGLVLRNNDANNTGYAQYVDITVDYVAAASIVPGRPQVFRSETHRCQIFE